MSSSQLTKSYFSEGWPNHQPVLFLPSGSCFFLPGGSHSRSELKLLLVKTPYLLLVCCPHVQHMSAPSRLPPDFPKRSQEILHGRHGRHGPSKQAFCPANLHFRRPGFSCSVEFLASGVMERQPGWWFGTSILFSHILGMSSSQLTKSYFSEGFIPNHQPATVAAWGESKVGWWHGDMVKRRTSSNKFIVVSGWWMRILKDDLGCASQFEKKGQRWFNKWCFLPHTKITSTWFLTWSIMYKHSSTEHRRNDSLGIFWKKVVHVGFPFYIGWPPVMSSLKKMFLGNLPTKHHPAMGSWGSLLPFHYFQWKGFMVDIFIKLVTI